MNLNSLFLRSALPLLLISIVPVRGGATSCGLTGPFPYDGSPAVEIGGSGYIDLYWCWNVDCSGLTGCPNGPCEVNLSTQPGGGPVVTFPLVYPDWVTVGPIEYSTTYYWWLECSVSGDGSGIYSFTTAPPYPIPDQPCPLDLTLADPTPAGGDEFGIAADISGSLALVGANQDDTGADSAGSVHLFDVGTGAHLRTIYNPSPAASDFFGEAVSISGTTALVGVSADDTGGTSSGIAYLFDASTGNLLHTLNNPSPAAFDRFGTSVSVSGDYALVGASGDDTDASNGGRAYLFDVLTGGLLHTLTRPSPAASAAFGSAVSISGGRLLIGASADDLVGTASGAAYLFDVTTGAHLLTIANPSPTGSDRFGAAAAISGDTLVVGAYWADAGESNSGAAYVFDAVSGALLHTLAQPVPDGDDHFGDQVDILGNTVAVGCNQCDGGGLDNEGAVFLFDAATGALTHTFFDPTPEYGDAFGRSVALSPGRLLAGAHKDWSDGIQRGSAYLFDLDSCIGPTPTAAPPSPTPMGPTPTPAAPTPSPSPSAQPSPTPTPGATDSPTPTPAPSPTASASAAPCCPGDADNSGSFVDATDFIAVQANFGADGGVGGAGDADCSGSFVDANDFIAVQASFGADCG